MTKPRDDLAAPDYSRSGDALFGDAPIRIPSDDPLLAALRRAHGPRVTQDEIDDCYQRGRR